MEEIQSNTCEIIKIDQKFIKEVENLKKEYLKIKKIMIHEIIQEIIQNQKYNIYYNK